MYLAAPGKERDLMFPIVKLQLEALEALLVHNNALTEEKKKQFQQFKESVDKLSLGQPFGGFKKGKKNHDA